MKVNKATIGRAVDQPDPAIRFYLFYGPDEGQSRALGGRLLEALKARKFAVAAGSLKGDPAALADEAGAMSLFDGTRVIWIEPASKDIELAVRALLDGPAPESPVVAIGSFTKSSPLVKLAENSPQAIAFAAYAPEGAEAERMVIDLGRRVGLEIGEAMAARLAASAGNDRAVVAQELEKLALYADASPQSPKKLPEEAIETLGADFNEGNFLRLADLALTGDVAQLGAELARLSPSGSEAIPAVRSLLRRLVMLAPARSRIERGERPGAVMTSMGRTLFGREKETVQKALAKWSAADLARVAERAGKLERELLFSDVPARDALGEELLAIARRARSS